ncbi:hypothetical protein BSLG_006126 [Batrachochytrium salamandrivorans]|nr:hypothetical protein BSLG_006126 [Batrachochytrium salamandrivorans]
MQLFYLFSFAVVASYAAALPQPAGLSEKYSNDVDATLVSGLEARSYQPVLDTREDSPTLMSLERRADSAGSSKGNFLFGIPPLSTLSPEEARKLIYSLFKPSDFSFENIASTIDNVGDGFAELSENGEKVKTKIVGTAGNLLSLYLRKATYVTLSLTVLASRGTFDESMDKAAKKEKESNDSIVNILKDTGTVLWDVEAAIESFVEAVDILVKFFWCDKNSNEQVGKR